MARFRSATSTSTTCLVVFLMFGAAQASRSLQQATPCGEFISGVDIPGENIFVVGGTADAAACLAECEAFDGCNAMIRLNSNGACFLKIVDVTTVEPVMNAVFTSYVICNEDVTSMPPGGTGNNPEFCDMPLPETDILGANIGSIGGTNDIDECMVACEGFDGCNAAIRFDANGGCFFKSVDVTMVEPVSAPPFTSYVICNSSTAMPPIEPTEPVQPPMEPVQPPMEPVQPPMEPVQPPMEPVQPPMEPVQPPMPEVNPACNRFLDKQDIPGTAFGSFQQSASPAACLAVCENTPGCNAIVRIKPTAQCFLKTVNAETVVPVDGEAFDSYLICPSDGVMPPTLPPGPMPGKAACDMFLSGQDIPGANIGATGGTADAQACLDACRDFEGCNAAIRLNSNGACFFKSVDTETVELVEAAPFTSYLDCAGEVEAPGPGIEGSAPPPGDGKCDNFLQNQDVPGGFEVKVGAVADVESPQVCLDICVNFVNCNAMVYVNANGGCFLKNVNIETIEPVANGAFTSYIICDPMMMEMPKADGAIAATGQFGGVIPFPVIPVAAAALPSGQVLVWSGDQVDAFGGNTGMTKFAVFDSTSDTVGPEQTVMQGHDMFCPGIAIQPNGDIIVVGGSAGGDGAGASSIWTTSGSWAPGPNLNIARGYNTAATMSNGDVFTLGGSFSGESGMDKGGEVLEGGAWRETTGIDAISILSDDPGGIFRTDNYVMIFPWTGNSMLHVGPSSQMNWFTDLGGAGTTTPAGMRGPTAMNGNAVMYDAGKILAVGGSGSFSLGTVARAGAEVITISAVGSQPSVDPVAGPETGRTYSMAVVLPTGEVAHFGGAVLAVEFSDASAVFKTEIWDPITQTWSPDASHAVPRTYHSSAVLLPDGRVFVGGGGLCGGCAVNHQDAEIYSPRYLFNADDSPATRPSITISASTIAPGGSFTVTGSESLSMVSMVRMGTSTHSTNSDQRRLELCGASSAPCGGATPTVTVPGEGIAIAGPWMVFGVNANGVVSVSAILNVT